MTSEVRERSRKLARRLGYGTAPENLPPPEVGEPRSQREILDRALVLNVVISCAYGLPTLAALEWLRAEGLLDAMTDDEREFLVDVSEGLRVEELSRKLQVESLFTLLWALSVVGELDFDRGCGDLTPLLPDVAGRESSAALRAEAAPRDAGELYAALDLATVLASAVGDEDLQVGLAPGDVEPYVVWERRRALAWIHGAAW
ncbi:MAG TPA: DUF4272 domain-containing protein [Acidimicrobiales bacterium]|nr:DUF4272 domain-containing protein [Acidimicrobiales bacterium]